MIKAVIFDMDGLMVDSEMISYKCFQSIIESYGFSFTKEDYMKDYPGRSLLTSIHFIKEYYDIDFDIDEKVQEFHQLENKYLKQDGVELKKGLIDLLEYLKDHHYKMIIATSSHLERALKLLEKHDVMKYFDSIICGNEVKHGKPFPDIFLKACEKLDVLPCEALVLEDSEAGIQAAYDAHIPVICIPDMKRPRPEYKQKVEKIYDSLDKVISYL